MNREEALDVALGQIERQFGKGSVMRMSDAAQVSVGAVSTGSLSLDLALGIGGLPRGRIVEIFGPESSGKTTLVYHVIAEAQRRGGICAFGDTTAPAATTAPAPTTAPLSTTEPDETSARSPIVAPSMCTLWPTVTSAPMIVGCQGVQWTMVPSCTDVRGPISIRPSSPAFPGNASTTRATGPISAPPPR